MGEDTEEHCGKTNSTFQYRQLQGHGPPEDRHLPSPSHSKADLGATLRGLCTYNQGPGSADSKAEKFYLGVGGTYPHQGRLKR